jgi:hypothetical protein
VRYQDLTTARWLSSGMLEAVSTSETSVNCYETTQRNVPKDIIFKNEYHYYCYTFIKVV